MKVEFKERNKSIVTVEVKDLKEAQKVFCKFRDENFLGASQMSDGKIPLGKTTLTISYNGRIWDEKGLEVII